jgi:L-amino acid N-acyltransferase YncA
LYAPDHLHRIDQLLAFNAAVYRHRIAQQTDLAAIVDIYNSTVASRMVTADLEPVSVDSRQQWFDDHRPAYRPLWVAEEDGRVIGWLSFSSFYGRPAYSKTAELSLYIHENWRGRGVGSYLLTQALMHAPILEVNTVLGFVFGHNEPSLNLFEKHGFARWGLLPAVAKLDGVERDLVILGRRC